MSKVDIAFLKILVNRFIEFDFDDKNQEIKIIEIITKYININFNKNLFFYIYRKLSKFFRINENFKDIKYIQKFEKVFEIWKLLILI